MDATQSLSGQCIVEIHLQEEQTNEATTCELRDDHAYSFWALSSSRAFAGSLD